MKRLLPRLVLALVLFTSGLAQAQWSLRLALEVPLHSHVTANGENMATNITDTFRPGVDLLGGYAVVDNLSLDLEFRTGLFATGSGYSRTPTTIGPGITYDVPTFPLYGRAAFPIQVERGFEVFLRLGGGLKIMDWGFFRIYAELTVDLALGGNVVGFAGSHAINAALGVWFRL